MSMKSEESASEYDDNSDDSDYNDKNSVKSQTSCGNGTGTKSPRFNCKFCGKKLPNDIKWKSHEDSCVHKRTALTVMQEGDTKFLCQICKQTFKYLTGLTRHERRHEPPGGFICKICGERFITDLQRVQHKDEVHKIYKCQLCEEKFTKDTDYIEHTQLVHDGKKKDYVVCSDCGQQFRSAVQLKHHTFSKCGTEKSYTCDQCGSKFMTQNTLNAHKMIHVGEKKHLCNFCGHSFLSKGQLKVHERSHTGEKPFKCDICLKSFAYRESLVTHSSLHTGIKPYICEACGSQFSCIGNLIKHRKARPDSCGLPQFSKNTKIAPRASAKNPGSLTMKSQKALPKITRGPYKKKKVTNESTENNEELIKAEISTNELSNHNENETNNFIANYSELKEYSTISLDKNVDTYHIIYPEENTIETSDLEATNTHELITIPSEAITEEVILNDDKTIIITNHNYSNNYNITDNYTTTATIINDTDNNYNFCNKWISNDVDETNIIYNNINYDSACYENNDGSFSQENTIEIIEVKEENKIGVNLTEYLNVKVEDEIADDNIPLSTLKEHLNDKTKLNKTKKTKTPSPITTPDVNNFPENNSNDYTNDNDDKYSGGSAHNSDNESNDNNEEYEFIDYLEENSEIISTKNEKSYECKECSKKYTTQNYLNKHIKSEHELDNDIMDSEEVKETDKCVQSKKKSIKNNKHRKSKGHYICSICNKKYININLLDKHELLHGPDGDLVHKCICCKLYFKTQRECEKHQLKFHEWKFKCQECNKIFREPDNLQAHIRFAHKTENVIPATTPIKKYSFMCPVCGKHFSSKVSLNDHERSDCGKSPIYKCDTCDKSYHSAGSLKTHQTIHSGVLPHLCKFCGKAFRTQGQVKVHERRHNGDKPFKCEYCSKTFAYRESLLTHHSLHTGLKRFMCQACGNRFSCISNLQAHRRSHKTTCGRMQLMTKAVGPMGLNDCVI